MRRAFVLILFQNLISFLCFSTSAQFKYFNLTEVYSINLPQDWRVASKGGPLVIVENKLVSSDDKFHENINIVSENLFSANDLKEYYEQVVSEMPDYMEGMKILGKGNTKVNGLPAQWISYKYISEIGEVQVRDMAYFFVHDYKGYIFTCSAEESNYSSYEEIFKEALSTIRFDTSGYESYVNKQKNIPVIKTEVSSKPKFEISEQKAKDLVHNIPFVSKKASELSSVGHEKVYLKTLIVKEATLEDPIYYVEAGENNPFNYYQLWKFSVNAKTGEVKYFNPNNGQFVSVNEMSKQ